MIPFSFGKNIEEVLFPIAWYLYPLIRKNDNNIEQSKIFSHFQRWNNSKSWLILIPYKFIRNEIYFCWVFCHNSLYIMTYCCELSYVSVGAVGWEHWSSVTIVLCSTTWTVSTPLWHPSQPIAGCVQTTQKTSL